MTAEDGGAVVSAAVRFVPRSGRHGLYTLIPFITGSNIDLAASPEGTTMPKGYWIARVDVDDLDEYKRYVAVSAAAYEEYGAVALARGGRSETVEGDGRGRNVIWEFPTYQAALDCYHSAGYQAARVLRAGIATGDFVMVEGVE